MTGKTTGPREFTLTPRERDIMILVGKGLPNADIAQKLGISARTVKATLHRICVKLGVRNRAQAVLLAVKHKAIGIPELFSPEEMADLIITVGPDIVWTVVQELKNLHKQGRLPAELEYILQLEKSRL